MKNFGGDFCQKAIRNGNWVLDFILPLGYCDNFDFQTFASLIHAKMVANVIQEKTNMSIANARKTLLENDAKKLFQYKVNERLVWDQSVQ